MTSSKTESSLPSGSEFQASGRRCSHTIEDVYQAFLRERRKRQAKVDAGLSIVVADDQRADESVPGGLDGGVVKGSNRT